MKKIRPLNFFLILIAIAICICFYVGLPYLTTKSSFIGIIILFVCSLAVFGLILYFKIFDNEIVKELKKEFKYLFHDSTLSWIIGLLLGSIITGFVLLGFGFTEYTHAEVNPSAFDIVSIYIGCVLGSLAIRAFYKSLHPIFDEFDLIKKITTDLKEVEEGEEVWFSFPGLNLCQFRIETNVSKKGIEIFDLYVSTLNDIIGSNKKVPFHGICYSKKYIDMLFDTYGEINKSDPQLVNIENAKTACKNCANKFVENIISATGEYNSTFYEMSPDNHVGTFVIIGDIVYTIQALGLPFYNFMENTFEDPFRGCAPDKKLVKLIAYRLYDKQLAETIRTRTQTLVKPYSNITS